MVLVATRTSYASEAMLLADQIGLRQIESGSRSAAAMVAALTGRAEDARATAEAGLAASRAAGEVTLTLALLTRSQGA